MPLGYIPGSHHGFRNDISHRIFGSRKYSRTIEFRIFKSWFPETPVKVLDIGAGVGELASQLSLLGHHVTALDFEFKALKQARSPYVPAMDLVVGDATCLPFRDESFDMIVCNSAIEHFPNDGNAITEMSRVVRKNGTVLVTTDSYPSQSSKWASKIPLSWRRSEFKNPSDLSAAMRDFHSRNCHVVNFYQAESLVEKFEKSGLQVEDWRYYLNGSISKAIYEAHIIVKWLDFYNKLSRRLFPLFFPFTYPGQPEPRGYGLAIRAIKQY